MDALTVQPALDDLYSFIGKVPRYPITIDKLVNLARKSGMPKEVIEFYDSFMPWLTFHNKDELTGCSEQVDIMRSERTDMPKEEERSPEEY